jgi:hypothetical protein
MIARPAFMILILALLYLGGTARPLVAGDAPAPLALTPAQPPVPVSLPADRNAFPADILARMRAALVAQVADPGAGTRPALPPHD